MNPSLILISIAMFIWGIGELAFIYFVPLYLQELGANPITIGTIFGGFGFVMMISHIPAGYLSDRIGRRPLILASWFIGLVATLMMGLTLSLPVFVAGYVLYGMTAFGFSPLFSYITAARGKLTVARANTLTAAMFNFGAIVGPISGGWIAENYGMRTIFLFSSIVFVLSTLVVIFLKPQPRDVPDEQNTGRKLFANVRFLSFIAIFFLVIFSMYLPQPLSPNFLQNERGISLGQMGVIGSFGSLGGVVFNLVLGQLSSRLGFVLGQTLVALFVLVIWRGTGYPLYMLAYFFLGGFRAARMLAYAQVRNLIHQTQMGLAYGIMETVSSMAMIVAPLLAGYMYDKNPASIYALSLVLIPVAIVVALIFSPKDKLQSEKVVL